MPHACARFRKMLRFREEHGLDAIRRDIVENDLAPHQFPHAEDVAAVWPYNLQHGVDRNGDVLGIVLAGLFDEGAIAVPRKEFTAMFVRNFLYQMEALSLELDRRSRAAGRLARAVQVWDAIAKAGLVMHATPQSAQCNMARNQIQVLGVLSGFRPPYP